jgi:hypothetical protein
MKIYFEDGVLFASESLKHGCRYIVNAASGYSDNERVFDRIMRDEPDVSVYTNSLVALKNSYCWNDDLQLPELYLRSSKTGEFVRVDELTGGKIAMRHHLLHLYMSGALRD